MSTKCKLTTDSVISMTSCTTTGAHLKVHRGSEGSNTCWGVGTHAVHWWERTGVRDNAAALFVFVFLVCLFVFFCFFLDFRLLGYKFHFVQYILNTLCTIVNDVPRRAIHTETGTFDQVLPRAKVGPGCLVRHYPSYPTGILFTRGPLMVVPRPVP